MTLALIITRPKTASCEDEDWITKAIPSSFEVFVFVFVFVIFLVYVFVFFFVFFFVFVFVFIFVFVFVFVFIFFFFLRSKQHYQPQSKYCVQLPARTGAVPSGES